MPDSIQGHSGMLVECNACHVSSLTSVAGGPHGMHSIGNWWIEHHHDYAEGSQLNNCRKCHGADSRGTVLSMVQGNRTFATGDFGTKTYFDGSIVSCYGCHNGPTSEDPTPNTRPTAQNAAITVSDGPVPLSLVASDPNGDPLTYRIVSQPAFGRVALTGHQATYIPDPGFAGEDTFTWAAYDTKLDSNLASVIVTRTAGWGNYAYGYPGTGGVVPGFTADGAPALGTTIPLDMQNTSGVPALTIIFASLETAQIDTKFGGVLLTEPVLTATFILPGTGLQLPFPIPSDPNVTGLSLFTQTIQQDAGATFGYAFSQGLRLTVGE